MLELQPRRWSVRIGAALVLVVAVATVAFIALRDDTGAPGSDATVTGGTSASVAVLDPDGTRVADLRLSARGDETGVSVRMNSGADAGNYAITVGNGTCADPELAGGVTKASSSGASLELDRPLSELRGHTITVSGGTSALVGCGIVPD